MCCSENLSQLPRGLQIHSDVRTYQDVGIVTTYLTSFLLGLHQLFQPEVFQDGGTPPVDTA